MQLQSSPAELDGRQMSVKGNFETSVKHMTPLSSESEQHVVLDEYFIHLGQFSIAINRIVCADASDENVVALLRLLAGLYNLLKTTLLSPANYEELAKGVQNIDASAGQYIRCWAEQRSELRQRELLDLAWFCDAALPRAHLAILIHASCPQMWACPTALFNVFAALKAVQHPLKGMFLLARFHTSLCAMHRHFHPDTLDVRAEETRALLVGYSVESFNLLLRLFIRWRHTGLKDEWASRMNESASLFSLAFRPYFEQAATLCSDGSFAVYEEILLPTFIGEVVNSADGQAQSLIFKELVSNFPPQYSFMALSPIIRCMSQFAHDVDLCELLERLFLRILDSDADVCRGADFFERVWTEIAHLIQTRCEIDPEDTVLITASALSLAQRVAPDDNQVIDQILSFLAATLGAIRTEGFPVSSPVGRALDRLLASIYDRFELGGCLLQLDSLPTLIDCLDASAARDSALQLLRRTADDEQSDCKLDNALFSRFVELLRALAKRDVLHMTGGHADALEALLSVAEAQEQLAQLLISVAQTRFSFASRLETCGAVFGEIDSPRCTAQLFIVPRLVETLCCETLLETRHFVFLRKIINALLANTSTALPPELLARVETALLSHSSAFAEQLAFALPDHPKLLAVRLNLQVARCVDEHQDEDVDEERQEESSHHHHHQHRHDSDFYSEVLVILNQSVAQESVKMEILSTLIESLAEVKHMARDDYLLLIDHVASRISLLLRKPDRCELLMRLMSLVIEGPYCDEERQGRLTSGICALLAQLLDPELRIELSLRLLVTVLVTAVNVPQSLNTQDIADVFAWIESQPDAARYELRLYPLRIRWDERRGEVTGAEETACAMEGEEEMTRTVKEEEEETSGAITSNPATSAPDTLAEDVRKLLVFQTLLPTDEFAS